MRIVFLAPAIADLLGIRNYIHKDNPEAAQKVGVRLNKLISGLAAMPSMGKTGRVAGTRELNTPKIGKTRYVIVYRVKDDRLEILRVLPGMRNIDSILSKS